MILKSPGFVPFGANLTQFGDRSDTCTHEIREEISLEDINKLPMGVMIASYSLQIYCCCWPCCVYLYSQHALWEVRVGRKQGQIGTEWNKSQNVLKSDLKKSRIC